MQRPRIGITSLKKNKVGDSHFCVYSSTKWRHADKWKRTENLKIDPYIYGKLILMIYLYVLYVHILSIIL